MLGLPRSTVLLSHYDDEWPQEFEAEAKRICTLIGDRILDIQHIGSTAIPGMIAKPVIDIAIAVRSVEDAFACIGPLESLGYTYRGVPDGDHYFSKNQHSKRTHQIHLWEYPNPGWDAHIRFRDRLRTDLKLADRYAELKQQLAAKHEHDKLAYIAAKTEFVRSVIQ